MIRADEMATFTGFPKETFAFLRGLTRNNSKTWFDAHRSEYDTYLMEPARAFVVAMGERFTTFAPSVVVDPRVNGSIRRINRDVRFSKDKRPYKTWFDMQFWEGEDKRCGHASFFLRMDADKLFLGAGMYEFPKGQLAAYRHAVVDPVMGSALTKVVKKVEKVGFPIGGKHYKRVPRDFDPDHERAELLKHSGLFAIKEMKLPTETSSAKLVTSCTGQYKKVLPLFDWLAESTRAIV